MFEAASPENNGSEQRAVGSLQHILEVGSRYRTSDGALSTEAKICSTLLDAGMLTALGSKSKESSSEMHPGKLLTRDEFLMLAENIMKGVETLQSNSSNPNRLARPPSSSEKAAEYLREVSASKIKKDNANTKKRKSLIIDAFSTATASTDVAAPVSDPVLSGIVREGWMMKLGQNRKNWKRRWFQLLSYADRGCSLLYFSEPPPSSSSCDNTAAVPRGNRKGAMHLTGPVAIDEVVDHEASVQRRLEHERQFSVTVATREIILSCTSAEERSEWIATCIAHLPLRMAGGCACQPLLTTDDLRTRFYAL